MKTVFYIQENSDKRLLLESHMFGQALVSNMFPFDINIIFYHKSIDFAIFVIHVFETADLRQSNECLYCAG